MITEVVTSALDLFSKPALETSIVKGSLVEVHPTNAHDDDGVIDRQAGRGIYLKLLDSNTLLIIWTVIIMISS